MTKSEMNFTTESVEEMEGKRENNNTETALFAEHFFYLS